MTVDLHSQDGIPGWVGLYNDKGQLDAAPGLTASRRLPISSAVVKPEPLSLTDQAVALLQGMPGTSEIAIGQLRRRLEQFSELEFERTLAFAITHNLVRLHHHDRNVFLSLGSSGEALLEQLG